MQILNTLPKKFFELDAKSLHLIFSGPTLVHLKGKSEQCVFISTLLHGDETTGLSVLQNILAQPQLPCSALVLFGNVGAARMGVRRLPNELDQNRIWADEPLTKTPWAQQLLHEVLLRKPLAAIDIHNTTGKTQAYSVISYLNAEHVFLASLFDPMVVHFREPHTTLVCALGQHIPAVVVECGPSLNDEDNKNKCIRFVNKVMTLKEMGTCELTDPNLKLYESFARVFVRGSVGFDDASCSLNLKADLDQQNMSLVPVGTIWGSFQSGADFSVQDSNGNNITAEYFDFTEGTVRVRKSFVPSLITPNASSAKDDCLCYLMKGIGAAAL